MAKKKIITTSKTTVKKHKKPLIKRIRFGRLLLVLILLSSIAYGSYVVVSEIYAWGSLKYAQYQENHQDKPEKPTIPPQFTDKRFENYTNILLIGIDDKPVEGIGESGRYADALMLVSMDHTNAQIRFLSLPRNIKTTIDGRKEEEYLSFTYYYGGAPLTVNTVSQLLNVPITQYIALDRKSIAKFVDTLGGINIYVERNMDYEDPMSGTSIHLTQGYQHLTGDMSQQYLIFRNDDLGDIGRVQRQQKFAKALFEKMMSIETLPTLPTMIDIWKNNMDTNINVTDISSVIDLLDTINSEEIKIKMLPGNLAPNGDWIPDNARVEQEINEMFPPVEETTE